MLEIKKKSVSQIMSIRDAVKKMDVEKLNSLIVHDSKKRVIGIFTMGDFTRAVFFGLDINNKISSIINKNFIYLNEGFSKPEAHKIFTNNKLILDIPVLNKNFQLIKIISKNIFYSNKSFKIISKIKNVPVVIMAGGKGTRLDPFTRVLPKSLIPYGDDPIIKVIMDLFRNFGMNKFYISVNEKSSMIKSYFHSLKRKYNISYIEEKKPLGTIGSLKFLKKKLNSTFVVTNSDILIFSHYPSIIEFHKKNRNDLTLLTSVRNYTIPYGVCDFDNSGKLNKILEKPSYDYFVNTGVYVFEPCMLKYIPNNTKFDVIQLIKKANQNKMKIGVYPIPENSWKDFGVWDEYKKNIPKLKT